MLINKTVKLIALVAIIIFSSGAIGFSQIIELKSPDGQLNVTFRTEEGKPDIPNPMNIPANLLQTTENLIYEVEYKGNQLLEPSAMGLELEDSRILGENVRIVNIEYSKGTDNYTLITGRTSIVSESYNSVVFEVDELSSSRKMKIEARAYDDAIAFRYLVPEQPSLIQYRLKSEKTEYRLAKDAMSYALQLPNFRSAYESEFLEVPVTGLSNQGGTPSTYLVGMPLLINMHGVGWFVITEADLENNAATYLRNPSKSWTEHRFESVVSPSLVDQEVAVSGELPHKTAWRVIMVDSKPTHFMVSNTLTNLNPDCRIEDTSWINPGKSAWDWWNGSMNKEGKSSYCTETMKYYVDFAAESGFRFMTVDAGWSGSDITKCRDEVNIPEITAYAKEKGVKIFIWVHSENLWNQMDEAFPLYEKWGVAGIKTDFIQRDDQPGIDFYYRVAEKAAKHKIMVDFHGCTKTWGLQRTYPNVVGYEGVLGMEQSKAGFRDNPDNHLIIPFTRMIGGLVDYTPGGFNNVKREDFSPNMQTRTTVMGTRAHHLAMYVVYESPLPMVSDWPEAYKGEPSFEFIKKVSANWDKSVVLNGYPGEYLTLARKKGDDWYLGAMTNRTPREYEIPLDFLENGTYLAEIYADAADSGQFPKKVDIKTVKVKSGENFKIDLASDGGLAVQFKKMK